VQISTRWKMQPTCNQAWLDANSREESNGTRVWARAATIGHLMT
jgi:hypothetical protein